jgi:F0F1-type ATP synthase membrane subunit c/vacuolar-type H+-ATPase subunit K
MSETTSTPTAEQPSAPGTEQPAATTTTPENPYAAPRTESTAPASAANGFSIASLVLGIASIPTGWAIAGILAIVFGFLARSREPQGRTMSTWGIVLGFVATFGWILVAILGLVIAAPFALWGMGFGWTPDFFDLY